MSDHVQEVLDESSSSSEHNQIHEHLTEPFQHQPYLKPFFQTNNNAPQIEEQRRIYLAAAEFNSFLKEALDEQDDLDDKLFQTEASEIQKNQDFNRNIGLNIDKMDGVGGQVMYQDDNQIRESIFKLKRLQTEEEQLLQNFVQLAKDIDKTDRNAVKRICDYFEALNYEIAIRSRDKQKLYEKILFKEEQLFKHIRIMENNFRKLEKDYTSIKKFHEIRSLRQTGRYKNNPQQLKKLKVSLEYSKETAGQKFLTQDTFTKHSELILSEKNINQANPITSMMQHQRQGQQTDSIPTPVKIDTKDEIVIDETSVYDWIVDIDLITSVAKEGWKVFLSKKFADSQNQFTQKQPRSPEQEAKNFSQPRGYGQTSVPPTPQTGGWEGATVAVVGLYDKGKTFVLNNLTQSNLPSGKKVNTKGISFKNVNVDSGTHLILVDTAGSYSPVKIQNELSIVEKEATEMFIMDLVFEISDYFICVVNDFTSLDQRYLDRLSRNLQNSPNKTFREIIVIHNLKEVESPEILEHVWSTQVTHIYQNGSIQRTQVAANNPLHGQLQEKHVLWFKTQFTRHVCLVNDDSYLGISINPWVFSLLRYWLKAVFVPVNRPFSVVDSIISFSKVKLSQYFRTNLSLKIQSTDDKLVKTIVTEQEIVDNVRIPSVSIDSSGLIMARPDSFLPATDIIATDKYIIYMDVPGLTKDEIVVYRQNVVTIIKGIRRKPYSEVTNEKLEKSERKYGEFGLSFKIPEIYERKWSLFQVENGVLTIVYDKDKDDQIVKSKGKEKDRLDSNG